MKSKYSELTGHTDLTSILQAVIDDWIFSDLVSTIIPLLRQVGDKYRRNTDALAANVAMGLSMCGLG